MNPETNEMDMADHFGSIGIIKVLIKIIIYIYSFIHFSFYLLERQTHEQAKNLDLQR